MRMVEDGWQETDARFYTTSRVLTHPDFLRLDELAASFDASIENFNKRGSNWQIDHIIAVTVATCHYRPTQGSSYVEPPKYLANKKAVINVQNPNDEMCFAWAVLSSLHPAKKPCRSSIQLPPIPERIKFERPTVPFESKRCTQIRKTQPPNIRQRQCFRKRTGSRGDPAVRFPRQTATASR